MVIYIINMNVWWENFVQLGIPLLIIVLPIVVAVILVRKENKKKLRFILSGEDGTRTHDLLTASQAL